jgi:diaminopimelate epimerase
MLKYHHLGIPTTNKMPGERYLEGHHVWVSGYEESNYNIEWMRYEPECTLLEIVKTVPHVAFEVDDVVAAIKGKKVIIQPNSPSEGVLVAFIEENGAPIELIHDKHLHGK